MCGIFFVHDPQGVPQQLGAYLPALRSIAHRGPDDEGTFLADRVFLGHRRLSILDLSPLGHQPMLSGDGQVALVFNGQIYNHRDLRVQLEALGHVFRSTCDTETLLAAYLQWGEACFEKLRGMWAVGIWDSRTDSLIVSRDRVGQKPLYLYRDGSRLVFASELKSILTHAPQAARMDSLSAYRFITRAWQDFSEDTFFAPIKAIAPGTVSVFQQGAERSFRIWSLEPRPNPSLTIDDIRATLIDTVARHLQGDVPVAVALSGGVDSGAIACISANVLGMRDKLHAFSVCPPDTPDETPLIDATVRHTGIAHTYVDTGAVDYESVLDDMLSAQDEPPPKSNHVYQFLLRRHVGEQGYKVLLVGEGADEIFGGYAKFAPMYLATMLAQGRHDDARAFLAGAQDLTGQSPWRMLMSMRRLLKTGIGRRVVQEHSYGFQLLDPALRFDESQAFPTLSTAPDGYWLHQEMMDRFLLDMPMVLRIEDRNGMWKHLEVRPPFLDHVLVDTAYGLPQHLLMQGGVNKWPLREAVKDLLTPEVAQTRVKMRRPGNDSHVVYDNLAQPIRDLLRSDWFRSIGIFADGLAERFEADRNARDFNRSFVWFRLYTFGRWYRKYVGR